MALSMLKSITRVNDSIKLDYESMSKFNRSLQGEHRLNAIEAELAEGNRKAERQRGEIRDDLKEIGADMKKTLDRISMLKDQVGAI